MLVAQLVKNPPAMQEPQETRVRFLGQKDSLEEKNGNPLQYSCLENPMDRGAWWATVHGVAESWTRLSDFTFTFMHWRGKCTPLIGREFFLININYVYVYGEGNGNPLRYSCLENPMDGGAWKATVHGVAKSRTQLSDFTFTFMHWRRKWQTTPVFLPGESQGRGSLVGCRLWGHRVRHD